MAFETILKLLERRLKNNWALTPIAFDNVEYVPKRGEAFIRATVSQTTSEATTIPANNSEGNYREWGIMIVQVFTPRNEGGNANAILADGVAALYRGYQEGRLFCQAPNVRRVGASDEFYQTNVECGFYYDNCLNA